MASEKEFVVALLNPDAVADAGRNADQTSKIGESDVAKTESDLTFVLDRIFEGVCRPFKVRVEQVLQSQPNLIISYKLSNTLEFYFYTVSLLNTSVCYFLLNQSLLYLSYPFVFFSGLRFARKRNSSL